jgi:hypothetical protein
MVLNLSGYISGLIGQPFVWGENDCLTFIDGAIKVQGGHGVDQNWLGKYNSAGGAKICYERFKQKSTLDDPNILTALLDYLRPELTLHPRTGMIVSRDATGPLGLAFGVVRSGTLWFMSEPNGLMADEPHYGDLYWSVI